MSIHNLDRMFHPKSVAVVGANEREGSIGATLMRNLFLGGYPGAIYPVNPLFKTVCQLPSVPSVLDLKESIDLAVICTPMDSVLQIVKECSQIQAGGAVIFSAGGRETGGKGIELEAAIKKEADASGLRLIGPNCSGIVCAKSKLNASFGKQMPLPGKTAFVSQSGSIYASILDISFREQIGFSFFVSLGTMVDADFGDIIDYLGGESDVSSIVIYVENLTRIRNFMSAARSVSRVKPVVALKAGRTGAGAKAALSHTGAMAGEDAIYEAAFQRAGIVRVKTFEELFDCAELLAKQPKSSGGSLIIITNGGGPGVIAADALSDYGIEPVGLKPETIAQLNDVLPPYWSHSNPVDILANASPETYRRVAEICLKASEADGLLILLSPHSLTDPTQTASALIDLIRQNPMPVFTSWMGGPGVEKGREIFNQAGVPTFDTPERAVRAFMDLAHHSRINEMLQQIPPKLPNQPDFDTKQAERIIQQGIDNAHLILTETKSKSLIASYGIPVNRTETASTPEQAWEKAQELGFPVVLKIDSPDITHKSDIGGVYTDLKSEFDVYGAFAKIMENAHKYAPNARVSGVTVQRMLFGADYELIIGAKKDRDFGPVILFGLGGTMTEVIRDQSIALPPLNRLLARRLMEQTKVWRLLQGFRNVAPANLTLIEEILIRIAQLTSDFPQIKELDINPLIVAKHTVIAADARVILEPSSIPAPLHLVISPYPNQYEQHTQTRDGQEIFVRPIRPEDAPLFLDLFHALSPQSVYYRFFSPIKSLSHAMLVRFTQIDYDREIALVAIWHSPETKAEQMLGVARVIIERNQKQGEFAVLVRDAWQGKGVGAALLGRCLSIAKERHIETVWGVVLPENTQMVALGRKLGFNIKRDPESGDFELTIDLQKLPSS